ncbi:MAG: tRNA (adenosine(37)-N6)-dimethylallyltransferase MiaA [bacterium]
MASAKKVLKPIIVVAGPTASGKTAVGIALARKLLTEVISADSRQIYRHMNIGTAKPHVFRKKTGADRRVVVDNIVHHMIDILDPAIEFSAGLYKEKVDAIIKDMHQRGKIPLIVGGTGLYIKAVTEGLCPAPPVDQEIRKRLFELAKKYGNDYLYRQLKKADPLGAKKIHPRNLVRVVRALEVYRASGIPLSDFHKRTQKPSYRVLTFALSWDREELRQRIQERTEGMFKSDLVREVKSLIRRGYSTKLQSMQGLGYKEIVGYINGDYDLEEAKRQLVRDTSRYAKRQMTWFRKEKNIHWIKMDSKTSAREVADRVKEYIAKKKMN